MWKNKNKSKASRAFSAPEGGVLTPIMQSSSDTELESVPDTPASAKSESPVVATKSSDSSEPADDSFSVGHADLAIKRGGEKFYDYYTAYKNIRELARPLNGLSQAAPIPRGLSIKKITVEFTVKDVEYIVEIPEPKKAGDIAPLISFAIRDLVEKMNNELHILSYLVSGMHNSVQAAFNARANSPPAEAYDNTNTTQ